LGQPERMRLGLTALRAVVGGAFFAHGAQKLFGWFGGPGPDALGQGFEQMGLRPGKRNAVIAGVSEMGGGAMLATGFLTPLGAAAIVGVMDQAVRTVHWSKGFFNSDGGYEYNVVLAASALAIVDIGPGPLSLDRALGTEKSGPFWALAALAAGLAGPRLVERMAPAPEPEPEPQQKPQPEPQRFVRDRQPVSAPAPAQRTA
jgi:putative oxidoreductase